MNYNKIGMYKRPMNFFEKLSVGWWWTTQIFGEWCYTINSQNDNDWEFFEYLQIDYIKYEEEMYYNGK
jgi:hypothetical protein